MKTKTAKTQSYIRAHHRGLMLVSILVMLICLAKFDSHLLAVFRQAYNQGFGIIGTYMREGEMTRYPIDFGIARVQTTSGV